MKKGFTLIELIVSIAIFAAMTALVIAKYGTFNQNTLLTNMAYDMALTIRTAQTYGLSVKSSDSNANNFSGTYGVHFDMNNPTQFVFYSDKNGNNVYDDTVNETITKYTLTQGAKIFSICMSTDVSACDASHTAGQNTSNALDIIYKRPNPDAQAYCVSSSVPTSPCSIINVVSSANPLNPINSPIAVITIQSSDGTNKQIVVVRRNGQISVGN